MHTKHIFEEIARIDLNEGFIFTEIRASELTHPHMGYPGVEVSMMGYFGRTRFKVTIDIGFGDIVEPIEYRITLTNYSKGDLFEDGVELACYPKEFIFAEKLETIMHRGSFNSRMKDFHDIYSMITSTVLLRLRKSYRIVFKHRRNRIAFAKFLMKDDGMLVSNFLE